jgi:predicted nucleic acid-binding protein
MMRLYDKHDCEGRVALRPGTIACGSTQGLLTGKVSDFLANVRSIAVTEPVVDEYARLKNMCMVRGMPQEENDLWIAATARAHHAVLVTNNSDMSHIPDTALANRLI